MNFSEWEPIYMDILSDLGFSREEDEFSVRILKALTLNSDLRDIDDLHDVVSNECTVVGDAPCLPEDIRTKGIKGTCIASGSSVSTLMKEGILPDIVVTDLDGEIQPQIDANLKGSVTLVHAHGNNADIITQYVPFFKGPIILTTQSRPENTVFNCGGFTDGDRCVCLAQEMGARTIRLIGFDYDNPNPSKASDPEMKKRKLQWAKRIIGMLSDRADIV